MRKYNTHKHKQSRFSFLRKIFFILFFTLCSKQVGAGSTMSTDPYTLFLRTTWMAGQRWGSHDTLDDNANYCWSVVVGCKNDYYVAERFREMSIKECGLNPLDNDQGMGMCGGTWPTLCKLTTKRHIHFSKQWRRNHPWDVNELLARRFYHMYRLELQKSYNQKLIGRGKISGKARKLLLDGCKPGALDTATKSWFLFAWKKYKLRDGWTWGDSRPGHRHYKDANDAERAFDYLCDIYSIRNSIDKIKAEATKELKKEVSSRGLK
jgi:hypothetical protein